LMATERTCAASSRAQQELFIKPARVQLVAYSARVRSELAASSRWIGRWRRGISLRRASENVVPPLFAHAWDDGADHVGTLTILMIRLARV
jgi:hypothetical protein